jgi:hypothetical protein
MKNNYKTIGALATVSALVAGNAMAGMTQSASTSAADQSSVQYELHTGYTSEYIFRGRNFGQDLIEAGADVATEWNGLELSAGAWFGSYDADATIPALAPFGQANQQLDTDELDLYAKVGKDLGFVTASVGYIAYIFDQADSGSQFFKIDDRQEVFFSLSRDLGFATASLTYFWDIETDNDGYSELALFRSFELGSCLDLNVATNVGYQVEQGQGAAWTTRVSLDYKFAERAKLSPFVALSIALSDDVDTLYARSGNELVAGSMLSVSF